jgi:hypothetical protein
MSLIAPGYLFSQHSLRTYQRCPRRFLLRYIDRQPWPAPEREDVGAYRAHLEAGRILHEWIARALLGIAGEAHDFAAYPDLETWWRAFERYDLDTLPDDMREVELPLVVPLGDYRLYARFDLLAWDRQQGAVIMDWKTLARQPSAEAMRRALQTRVYLYALVTAGAVVTGGPPIAAEQARMTYWFAPTEATVELPYTRALYEQDRQMLLGMVQRIAAATREEMARTSDVAQCAACGYRTLCEREALPGASEEQDWLAEDLDFELDQVPEVDF